MRVFHPSIAGSIFLMSFAASAATYTPISDDELLRRSPVVVHARVIGLEMSQEADGMILTDVTVSVLEYLKGSGPGRIQIALPGGQIGEEGWFFEGAPRLQQGEEAILFLGPFRNGQFALSELGLSKFDILQDATEKLFATRAMFSADSGGRPLEAMPEPPRPLGPFLSWLRSNGLASETPPSRSGRALDRDSAQPLGRLAPRAGHPAPLWADIFSSPTPVRWPWDIAAPTASVMYQPAGGQSSLNDGTDGTARLANAVNSWKGTSGTDIRTMTPTSGTGATIQVSLNDLTGGAVIFSPSPGCYTTPLCGGGTQGCAGAHFVGTHIHDGRTYSTVTAGYVFIRAYSCTSSAIVFENVVAHEFGHTLGFNHSDTGISVKDPDQVQFSANHCLATMRSCFGNCGGGCGATDNLRSPFVLGADDQIAARYVYPSAAAVTLINPNGGTILGGTPVTISGAGFLAGATVSIGGSAATSVTVVSPTSISAITAAHATGIVSVDVVNPSQSAVTLANGYFYFPPLPAARFYTVVPCRLLDTRLANGALGGPILSAGQTRTFPLTGVCSVPAAARALSVNVTVTQPAAAGVLQLTPGDAPQVNSTTLNFTAGRTLANNASLLLATDGVAGTVKVFNNSGGTSHLIIDVNGYYR